jgi:hypothetical protein
LKNKNTIGVHFTGNFGYIDNMGFLVIKENIKESSSPDIK